MVHGDFFFFTLSYTTYNIVKFIYITEYSAYNLSCIYKVAQNNSVTKLSIADKLYQ